MKNIVISLILLASIGMSYAQNPTVINTATNQGVALYPTNRHTGIVTLGISTNGATTGRVLTWTNNIVHWSVPTGGGGGGGDVGATSNNVFTATNTFNGPVNMTNLVVSGTFNQIPLSFSFPVTTFLGNSNWLTFAHSVIPSGKTVTINRIRILKDDGTNPLSNQVMRIFNATLNTTLLVTNANWDGTITITNLTRWYARFENNSSQTNLVNASGSIQGNEK